MVEEKRKAQEDALSDALEKVEDAHWDPNGYPCIWIHSDEVLDGLEAAGWTVVHIYEVKDGVLST